MASESSAAQPERMLVKKLAAVMAAVHRIPKRGRNDHFGYNYAREVDIVAVIRKELATRQVMVLPQVNDVQRIPVGEKGSALTTLLMAFTFYDGDSGETITMHWAGAGTDKEDKGLYKAMTGAEKYFLLKTFLIETGDDPEATDGQGRRTDRAPAAEKKEYQRDPNDVRVITQPMVNRLRNIIREAKGDERTIGQQIRTVYGWSKWSEIQRHAYDTIVAAIQGGLDITAAQQTGAGREPGSDDQ